MRRNALVSLSDTHTWRQRECLSPTHTHTHTHTPEQPPPPDTCQHSRCGTNILWARPAGKICRSKTFWQDWAQISSQTRANDPQDQNKWWQRSIGPLILKQWTRSVLDRSWTTSETLSPTESAASETKTVDETRVELTLTIDVIWYS